MADEFTYMKLPADPCLTQEQMTDYIDGKLAAEAQHACEKHMLDCEMCADAIEGLSLVKDRAVLSSPIKTTTSDVAEKGKVIGLNQTRNQKTWYAVAAVFVLVLASTFFINKMTDQDEASVTAESKVVLDSSVSPSALNEWTSSPDSVQADLEEQGTDRDRSVISPSQQAPAVALEDLRSGERNYAEAEDAVPATKSVESYEVQFDQVQSNDGIQPQEKIAATSLSEVKEEESKEEADKKTTFWEKTKITVPGAANKSRADQMTLARDENKKDASGAAGVAQPEKNNAGNVPAPPQSVTGGNAGAAEDSEGPAMDTAFVGNQAPHPLKPSDNDLELSYVNGVKLLNSGQYNSAIVFFDEVLKNKAHARYEDAEFQKANALLKSNRKEEAKLLLQSIELKKGKHAAEATELLKTL